MNCKYIEEKEDMGMNSLVFELREHEIIFN